VNCLGWIWNINKIFKSGNILRLSKTIFDLYSKSNPSNSRFIISLFCKEDNSTYEIEGKDFNSESEILELKRFENIGISFQDYIQEKYVNITLFQDPERLSRNELKIESREHPWTDQTFKTITDILNAVTPQNLLLEKYGRYLYHFIALNIGLLVLCVIRGLILHFHIPPSPYNKSSLFDQMIKTYHFTKYIILFAITWAEGASILFPLWRWLLNLWPSVEFDFGPEHLKASKNVRKALWLIISLILFPLIINLISAYFFINK